MNSHSDKRDFDRFPIEFEMEVIGTDPKGKKFFEKTRLKDVSGGGVSFVPILVGNYFTGQPLELKIYLPGAGNLSACLEGSAKVIRIIKAVDFEINKGLDNRVAVMLNDPLQFEISKVNT